MLSREKSKIVIKYYQPPQPAGYWIGHIEDEEKRQLGFFHGKTKEIVYNKIDEYFLEEIERENRRKKIKEWRDKYWWRRLFRLRPKNI